MNEENKEPEIKEPEIIDPQPEKKKSVGTIAKDPTEAIKRLQSDLATVQDKHATLLNVFEETKKENIEFREFMKSKKVDGNKNLLDSFHDSIKQTFPFGE